VTKSPRLYVLFRTAVPGIKPVTRLPFVGLCSWVVRSLSPYIVTGLIPGASWVRTSFEPQANLGTAFAGLRPKRKALTWGRRRCRDWLGPTTHESGCIVRATRCSCWRSSMYWARHAYLRAGIATEAQHWAALLSLRDRELRLWIVAIGRDALLGDEVTSPMYCSAQPCLASSQSLVYLLWVYVAKWCGAYHLTAATKYIKPRLEPN